MNVIAKTVHCTACGAPRGMACQQLRPDRKRVVPTHSARRKLYAATPAAIKAAVVVAKLRP